STFCLLPHTPPPAICTLSLHDALPISSAPRLQPVSADLCGGNGIARRAGGAPAKPVPAGGGVRLVRGPAADRGAESDADPPHPRSEEHTSELQSLRHLVCRLLLEKKKE